LVHLQKYKVARGHLHLEHKEGTSLYLLTTC
jgi:hypothetical protein